jgi:hypothetical protein
MYIRKIIILLIGLFSFSSVFAQTHHVKHFKHISRLKVINRKIPSRINESSGLIFFRDKFWTHNDSGDGPYIYAMDTLGRNIEQIITIQNGRNIDWEEISQDERYIFIGDFGNNYGLRNRMVIYRIDKNLIPDTGNCTIGADSIIFSYKNKPLPSTKKLIRSDYDCEAMIAYNDTLILFSKNWKGPICNIYFLPAQPGTYELSPVQTIIPDGLITAASLSYDKTKLLLLGYKDYCPFVYLINKFHPDKISLKKAVHKYFSARLGFQTEGISFVSQDEAYISCEYNKFRPGTLFKIKFR